MDMLAKTQPELPASVEHGLCSRFRTTKSYCTSCAVVCPVPGAVQFAEQGAEITDACVGCGACASACPNGAISLKESDSQLAERIRSRVRSGEAFRISCPRAEGKVDLVLPCLSRLTEALLLEPIQGGAARVELLDPGCSDCGLSRAAPPWERSLFLAQALCETAGFTASRMGRVQVSVGKPEPRDESAAPNPRRAMFRAIAEKWKETATVAATEFAETGQQAVEPFRDAVQRHHGNPKRTELLQVLRALPGAEARSKSLPAAGLPLADVEVGGQCVGCNVCETLCPVGALRHREANGVYALDFYPALCTGCRVCEAACFYQAIRIRETVELSVLFDQPSVTLVSAPRRTCRSCHESFLGETSEVCPSCQVSGDRRESIARNFFLGGTQGA
ncbi:MAG: 4Fe-4S binding protein [Sulfuricella sp.]|nr:4Fe-4S binding protein [Sulfuricella sp.]